MLEAAVQNSVITEQRIFAPFVDVLEDVISKPVHPLPQAISLTTQQTIHVLFPEQAFEEKNTQRAKEILGTLASSFNKIEMRDLVAQVEYLAETWLDEFERDVFNGKTLNEVLHDKGGL